MKLVVDTNIILKALIKDSKVRGILLNPKHQFSVPEYALEETEKHILLVREKTSLSEEEIKHVLNVLLTGIEVIPSNEIRVKWNEAEGIMDLIDAEDMPFVAAALAITCDGIWSDDRHLKRQKRVKVWSTKEMMKLM